MSPLASSLPTSTGFLAALLGGLLLLGPGDALAQGEVLLTSRRLSSSWSDLYEYDLYLVGPWGARRLTDWPGPEGEPVYSAARDRIVFTGKRGSNYHLWEVSPDGSGLRRLTDDTAPEGKPTLTQDGRTVIYPTRNGGTWYLARRDLQSGEVEPLVVMPGANAVQPELSPDGRWLAFDSDATGDLDVYLLELATGEIVNITDSTTSDRDPDFSPDSTTICYTSRKGGRADIHLYEIASRRHRMLTDLGAFSRDASFSPDGQRVIFVSHFEGPSEVYTVDLEGGQVKRLAASKGSDSSPRLIRLSR